MTRKNFITGKPFNFLKDLTIGWGADIKNFVVTKVPHQIALFYYGRNDSKYHILFGRHPMFLSEEEVLEALIHELEHYYLTKLLKKWRIKPRESGLYPEWITSNPSFQVSNVLGV